MKKLETSEIQRLSIEEFQNTRKNNFVIVLDDVRSLHNVGSTFRTADAFAAEKIYLCGITGTPPNREIQKTALGATESVIWEYADHTIDTIKKLKNQGYTIISIEQAHNSTFLQNFNIDIDKKYALVFGNEVFGVNADVVANSDICLEIPQFGTKHSLNVSVSVGIVCWHFINGQLKTTN
ncbi:MAG: RNA methyltransferase [Raineya sp.]|jgi:tRNA G18 (ribose-2'-O)-methylase SpoU|nr:RNA methyltransferase [Raineya sp.]